MACRRRHMPPAVIPCSARTVVCGCRSNAHTSRPERYNAEGGGPKPTPIKRTHQAVTSMTEPVSTQDQVAPVILPRRARLRTVMLPYAVISA